MKCSPTLALASTCCMFFSACTPLPSTDAPSPVPADSPSPRSESPKPTHVGISFSRSIRPILANNCTICHNTEVLPTRPNFETKAGAMQSGMIVPGKPEASRILTVVEEDPAADKAMPPVSHRLTKEQIATLRQWISEGASWPAGEAGRVKPAFIPKE